MEQKPIKCKPTNSKTRGYESCEKPSKYRNLGLCPSCFYDWMKNDQRGKIYKQSTFDKKVSQKLLTKKKEKDKEKKDELTNWRSKLQTKIQLISRLIDKGLKCLARNQLGQIHGGHIFAKGGNSTIALNLHNIHRQSAQSNKWKNDDGLLREKLALEYGSDYYEFVSGLRKHRKLEISNKEFKELYELSLSIILMLKKKDLEYSLTQRIQLRNEINLQLGIYDEEYCVFKSNKL